MTAQEISAEFKFEQRSINVLDSTIAFVDTGKVQSGHTCIFLHGNPTSAYLWRNIILHVAPQARCIAPDLIGMGRSGKPENIEYRFTDHRRYVEAFLKIVVPDDRVVLVLHDWGAALGLDWARYNENRVAGLVLMEFVRSFPSWDAFPEAARATFQAFRSPELGRRLLIEQNAFVEEFLPAGVVRKLTETEMDHYRQAFLSEASREPIWRWPNELPVGGTPVDVARILSDGHHWLLQTPVPKILFWATPGGLLSPEDAAGYARTMKNARAIDIGAGIHYLQEDNPHLIGTEISKWLASGM
ncbi:hypothetical protein CLAIMM_00134 [Cladophialophora immunda]|nr:hypothetical protein CLAIMM_00134 [Cladophialophora immunda]